MIVIYDRASQARALSAVRDPRLVSLLLRRFAALVTADGDLTDWTEFVIFELGDREEDIVHAAGFSPLVEPIDGARFDGKGFQPFWDHLVEEDGHYVLTISFGSTFGYVLILPDTEGVLPELLQLCREYTR